MDTDIIAAANGAERVVPHESTIEEDTKAEGLRSGQNGDVPLVNASVKVVDRDSRYDETDQQPESNSNDGGTMEE
ncbi:hypothetical protein CJ030_MR0G020167 [Morella rubra]|uniref:Uncharacterized protein n=1 Tax=Morella rubra TaxID=262757 RepID=A0A6A1UH53_9ROSI|nr:hypothetical protein CJ030_MR0G020167 [Morella rubra]